MCMTRTFHIGNLRFRVEVCEVLHLVNRAVYLVEVYNSLIMPFIIIIIFLIIITIFIIIMLLNITPRFNEYLILFRFVVA